VPHFINAGPCQLDASCYISGASGQGPGNRKPAPRAGFPSAFKALNCDWQNSLIDDLFSCVSVVAADACAWIPSRNSGIASIGATIVGLNVVEVCGHGLVLADGS
jgi:hypothetical protein